MIDTLLPSPSGRIATSPASRSTTSRRSKIKTPTELILASITKGTIVQANPDLTEWGPSLVVVDEVKTWGIQGYTHIPRSGDAYIRLKWEEIELTGGKVEWDTA